MEKVISLSLVLCLFCSCKTDKNARQAEADAAQKDFVIVPGERVGLIRANTTEAEVEQYYGVDNIKIQEVPIAEGDVREGVLLFPGTKNELEIVWDIAANFGQPDFIRISQDDTDWKTQEGITVGTTLEALEKINGKPFKFYGFGWDYGGLVTNWNGGKLNNYLLVALIPQNFDKLDTTLQGEVELSSDDPKVRELQAKIGSIVITFQQ